jgi:hypothetical protein
MATLIGEQPNHAGFARQGEESEDEILRRLLWSSAERSEHSAGKGVADSRYAVSFPEGFTIFRRYLGKDFRAVANDGRWLLQNSGKSFGSLNELSKAIGAKTENAWVNWNFEGDDGEVKKVSELRKPSLIVQRPTRHDQPHNVHKKSDNDETGRLTGNWVEDLITTFRRIPDRNVPLTKIYAVAKEVRRENGRSVPPSLEATIRERLESHSSDSENFKGDRDLFCMPLGKGKGIWALRDKFRQ